MRYTFRAALAGVFVSLTTVVLAADPIVYPQQGAQKFLGLDDSSAPTQVADGRAQDIQNVLLSDSYDMRKRYGVSLPVTVGTDRLDSGDILDIAGEAYCAVTGAYYTKFSSGQERIIATCGGRFYYINGITSWDVVPFNGAQITGGKDNQFVWATALDNVIGTNDVDAPIQYDGSTVGLVSFSGLSASQTPSAAKVVSFFKNYLIFMNTVENSVEYPTRFRFSNVGTINTWSDDDYIDIGALGGQEINCVGELYDTLIVGLTDSLYKISLVGGSDTFQVSKITDDIGCIAKGSMQSITLTNSQSGLVFLDKDKKIYFYNGTIAQDISRAVSTTMNGLNGSRLQYAVSADTNTDYWLCVTSGTESENNLCLDLQYEIGEWTKHTNIPANAMAHVIDNNSNDQVYWGSYKSLVYQLENTTLVNDVGSTTPSTITVDSVGTIHTATASGLQVMYDTDLNMTPGAYVGAPIELIGGTGESQTGTIADNTSTGIIVTDAFATTPDSSTTAEIGAIDSFYTSKWYDFGAPATLKHFGEVYFWAQADVSSTHNLSYATDYSTDVESLSLSMSSSTSDAIWGSAIWGVSLWGDVDDVFRQAKMTTQGRYLRIKWSEDDPHETFHIYGYSTLFWPGDAL
jgi:hypothetical protein